jgi:plasmid stability protein
MAQILVRNLDDDVVARLKAQAKENGRSLQAQAKSILERAASQPKVDMATARGMCEAFRKRFRGRDFPDSVDLIREDRDR